MAKKKKLPSMDTTKRIELPFPIPHDLPIPKEIIPVPVLVNPITIERLVTPVELTHCEATLVDPWFNEAYLWLKLPPGFKLPLEPGQTIKVDVKFLPPATDSPAMPHD
jgi:hypothetical protein